MPLRNTPSQYGTVTKTIHWLMALLIFSLIGSGMFASQLPFSNDAELARKAQMFSLHKTFGVLVFFLALIRILWAMIQPKPRLLNADNRVEGFAAHLVHWLLYGALVIVPLSGWISHAAAQGFAPLLWPFGQNLPLVPKSVTVEHSFAALHWLSGKVLIASIALHTLGALKHHFIDRDHTLRRMLPGPVDVPTLPQTPVAKTPLLSACMLWLVVSSAAMLQPEKEPVTTANPLSEITSQWQVETGQIEITIVQFGAAVTGQFGDWTAAIRFDETLLAEHVGHVTTTIAIPSLTLGSVTDQALGADFFDAANHPRAVFDADIIRVADGYAARGTLTLKERSVPLFLPFDLTQNEDHAEMQMSFALQRLDFGIGENMPDGANLALEVKVNTVLTARRNSDTSK